MQQKRDSKRSLREATTSSESYSSAPERKKAKRNSKKPSMVLEKPDDEDDIKEEIEEIKEETVEEPIEEEINAVSPFEESIDEEHEMNNNIADLSAETELLEHLVITGIQNNSIPNTLKIEIPCVRDEEEIYAAVSGSGQASASSNYTTSEDQWSPNGGGSYNCSETQTDNGHKE